MIEEQGRVIAVQGTDAWVKTFSQGACQSCRHRSGCGQQMLAGTGVTTIHQVRIGEAGKAKVGDQVLLGISEATLLQAAVLVYLVPLLGLIAGALLANLLMGLGDGGTALASIAGMGLALFVVRVCQDRTFNAKFCPVLLRVQPDILQSSTRD